MKDVQHRNEDEYFLKLDAELIKKQRAKLDEDRRTAERQSHRNKCPRCGADLVEREFHHVKIDGCPDCDGVWLDKGEVEMLLHVEENNFSRFISDLLRVKFT